MKSITGRLLRAVGLSLLACMALPSTAGAAGTNILNQDALLSGHAERQWYKDNVPFLEVPDATLQQIYYYRWSSYKRHVHYTNPANGYIVTEFAHVPGYAGAFGAINAAAGHHIYEGRWLKTQRYLDDYELFWLRGSGRNPTSGTDTGGINSAHQYSFWAADAYYNRFLVNSDQAFINGLLGDLTRQYNEWSGNFDSGRGLYWQVPVWDAMEFTIGSYQTNDPYHGGAGFRPTLNAYQWADARAISAIATLAGQSAVATDFNTRAASLKSNMQSQLWDPGRNFFFHMMRNNAAQAYPFPEGTLLDGREEIGFTPWAFNMPDSQYSVAWQQLMDAQGFYATYGPTTAERRHRFFMREATAGCCRWDGPSWPFSTSQTLMALGNLLNNYSQSYVTKDHYFTVLKNYALSHYKNGLPYISEAHDPDNNNWIYDGFNHSEHYNHSTFNDLVISGLIGLRPRGDNTFVVNPLVPSSWNYFVLENVLYHGHLMTILWDRDGTRYGRGAGLRVFQDGVEIGSQATLGRLQVTMATALPPLKPTRFDNFAANPARTGFPSPIASYTNSADDGWETMDGDIWYDDIPDSRWTAYTSPNATDWFGINFGTSRTINEVRLYLYDDGGGVRAPASYNVQYWNGSAWVDAAGQVKTPAAPAGRDLNIVRFNSVATTQVRVVFTHAAGSKAGLTEFEVWSGSVTATPTPAPTGTAVPIVSGNTYSVANYNSGKCVAAAASGTANGTSVQQYTCNTSTAQQWVFTATDSGYFQIATRNAAGQVWDVVGGATATGDGAKADLWAYGGGTHQQWKPTVVSGPYYQLQARHSGKCLDVSGSTMADVQLQQWTCNISGAQLWSVKLVSTGATPTPTATATPTPTGTTRATATPTATATATPTATTRATPTPTGATGTVITLPFNVNAAYSDGTTFASNGGLDGVGSAYSSTLLGASFTWSGTTFNFGPANALNGVRNTTITLPAGQYATLMLLGTGVNGDQASQTVRVNYTDGTNQTFTQTFSNWLNASQNVAGQSVARTMAYRNKSTGVADNRAFNLYGYSFALTSTKTVSSLVLPATNNVSILAATLRTAAATPTPTPTPTTGGAAAWAPNVAYAVGNLATYGGVTYRCIQAHTSQVGWEPPNAASLWTPQ